MRGAFKKEPYAPAASTNRQTFIAVSPPKFPPPSGSHRPPHGRWKSRGMAETSFGSWKFWYLDRKQIVVETEESIHQSPKELNFVESLWSSKGNEFRNSPSEVDWRYRSKIISEIFLCKRHPSTRVTRHIAAFPVSVQRTQPRFNPRNKKPRPRYPPEIDLFNYASQRLRARACSRLQRDKRAGARNLHVAPTRGYSWNKKKKNQRKIQAKHRDEIGGFLFFTAPRVFTTYSAKRGSLRFPRIYLKFDLERDATHRRSSSPIYIPALVETRLVYGAREGGGVETGRPTFDSALTKGVNSNGAREPMNISYVSRGVSRILPPPLISSVSLDELESTTPLYRHRHSREWKSSAACASYNFAVASRRGNPRFSPSHPSFPSPFNNSVSFSTPFPRPIPLPSSSSRLITDTEPRNGE